jgi:alcohol dehydrogenase class IV
VPLPVIAIPTTAGTGSEATRTAVFTDHAGRKVWAWGETLRPTLALLDPTLTTGLPPALTAISGLDALVHAIEAATGQRATPASTGHALEAIRLAFAHLETAVRQPNDLAARAGMLRAACLAGRAIDAGGTGVAHGLGHALGTIAKVPHGLAVALALRAALAWNAAAAPARFREIARAMDVQAKDDAQIGPALAGRYDTLLRSVDCPLDLARYGLGKADASRLTHAMLAPENRPMLENNARPVDADAAAKLTRRVLQPAQAAAGQG